MAASGMLASALLLAGAAAIPAPTQLPAHPRLLTNEQLTYIQSAIAAGGDAALFSSMLFEHADWVLTQPPTPRGEPDASGVLTAARQALDYLLTSALAYRLNSTATVYRDRAFAEGLNLAQNWTDWNTLQHALDTGEAMFAAATAYDWLYNDMDAVVSTAWMDGIVTKGLQPYRQYIGNRTAFWWINNTINWNCVCSSGGITGVLGTFGDVGAPSWAWDEILNPLMSGVTPCIGAYNKDSSWEEGPGYWAYASKYNVWLFHALQTVLNSTYGLTDIPGVAQAARFPIYSTGADAIRGSGNTFDWADSHSGFDWTPFSQWWGTAFNESAAAYYSRLGTTTAGAAVIKTPGAGGAWGGFVEALVFYTPLGSQDDVAALPTAKLYDYINVGVFRGPWDAPSSNQTYLGFKGGNNDWNHGHLDLGSFVFDYSGTRFAEDMGGDSYELPGYFDNKVRWGYYRMSSRGHNLVLFGNVSQGFPETAEIIAFNSSTSQGKDTQLQQGMAGITVDGWAVVNLTDAYAAPGGVSSYLRGFVSLANTNAIIIVDEWTFTGKARPANLTWQLHTRATAKTSSSTGLTLTSTTGGISADLAVINPTAPGVCPGYGGFVFTDLAKVLPDPPFDSAVGYTRIDALVQDPASPSSPCSTLRVALGEPDIVAALAAGTPSVLPIAQWATQGPVQQ